mgnify:CR=1 FL=1
MGNNEFGVGMTQEDLAVATPPSQEDKIENWGLKDIRTEGSDGPKPEDNYMEGEYVPTEEDIKMAEKLAEQVNDTMKVLKLSNMAKTSIIYEGYINSHPYLSGGQKRTLRRKIERQVRSGKYDGLFRGADGNESITNYLQNSKQWENLLQK